jgi:hypothetical protein
MNDFFLCHCPHLVFMEQILTQAIRTINREV